MRETAKERHNRLSDEFDVDTAQWVNGQGARKTSGFRYVDGAKVFDDFEAYLNG